MLNEASAPAAVELRSVDVVRGTTRVLTGFSLTVGAGSAIGIVGRNGTGKTTVLDALSGLVQPSGGSIHLDGVDATGWNPRKRNAAGLRRTFQESHLYPHLTVAETLRIASQSASTEALAEIGLEDAETRYVAELSTGQRRLLDVIAATSSDARILLLDEPTAGVAPRDRARILETIRRWRVRTEGTLIVVEHDREALAQITDAIVEIEPSPSVDKTDARSTVDLAGVVADVVNSIGSTRTERHDHDPFGPSVWSLARFGLREFAAGMLSVLTLGVLNRVMKVELGIPLIVVAPILAAYNLAAPIALWIGSRSDRHPWRGLHRTPYIVGGSVVTAAAAIAAPFVAWMLADHVGPIQVLAAVGVFATMGAGMYGSGATYFALLADVVEVGREKAVAIVYSMLMVGILAGVALTSYVLPEYEPRALLSLHVVVAATIVIATWWAVRHVEPRAVPVSETARGSSLRTFARSAQARRFFVFMIGWTFFAFLQQAILEPFGGEVFDLSVRATTSFNAVQIVGVVIGMAIAARMIAPRIGKRRTTAAGCVIAAVGLVALATSGFTQSSAELYFGITAMGIGLGVLNVGSLSLMLDMTTGAAAGLAMGLWTVAHALADGAATAGGGILHWVGIRVFGSEVSAYASVFAIEAVGLLAVVALIARIDPTRLEEEVSA